MLEFQEKPQTADGAINGGFFVCEPGVFDYLEDDDKASGTIAMYTIVLRQFFEFHDREDLVKKIKSPTIKRTKRASVSSEWWMEMYKAAGFHDENGERNQALLSVLLGTGMRIGEAIKIKGMA